MRGLCVSFTCSWFLFPVGGGGSKTFEDWDGGLKNFRTVGVTDLGRGTLVGRISNPLHVMNPSKIIAS